MTNSLNDFFDNLLSPPEINGVERVRDAILGMSYAQMIYVAKGLKEIRDFSDPSDTADAWACWLNAWALEHKALAERQSAERRKERAEQDRISAERKSVFQALDYEGGEKLIEPFKALAKRLAKNEQHDLARRIEDGIRAYENRHNAEAA